MLMQAFFVCSMNVHRTFRFVFKGVKLINSAMF